MIIATAGHIDHGKTTLVKALSGVDTDSLPEEKARGISIDLGFAYWQPPEGGVLGFVDVPGHERFVRNMLAGVCGIDYVMLVIAADDGVMPQTIEHLHIIDLLGVSRGVAVITKIDRVSPERVHEVAAEARVLLESTVLAGIDIVSVSAQTGDGVAQFRDLLAKAAQDHRSRRITGRNFRYAIDRAFSIAGSGTVVTGTVFDGTVTVGDRLTLTPGSIGVRIRGIQKNGVAARHASAGERCGLNLAGAGLEEVSRGDWVVAPFIHAPTQRIDVRLNVLATETQNLKHWTPVHLHLGTAERVARVAIRRGASMAPGQSGVVQLILDKGTPALNGDRFIIRDQSARRTLGGGMVIDPFAPKRRINKELRTAQLNALQDVHPSSAMRSLLACSPSGVDLEHFQRAFNLTTDHLGGLTRETDFVVIGKAPRLAFLRAAVTAVGDRVIEALQGYQRDAPHFFGAEIAKLRQQCAPALSSATFNALLRLFADGKRIELSGSLITLPKQRSAADSADEIMWQRLQPMFDRMGFKTPLVPGLAQEANIKQGVLEDFLYRQMRSGEVYLVAPGRFYPRSTMAQLAALALDTSQSQPEGQFTAAQFRDRSGVNRALAIEILECLDRLGITQRIGNMRIMRKDFVLILGPATLSSHGGTQERSAKA